MTIKIEFPADRLDIAAAFGAALTAIGGKKSPDTDGDDFVDRAVAAAAEALGTTDENFTEEEKEEQTAMEDTGKVDTKGVPFDPEFCGKAADPFYKSGPRDGQWKKKKGVDDGAYDAWYAKALSGVAVPEESPVNTAGAFGGPQNAPSAPPVPHDAGSLMAWVAEMQTAGRITQEQVNAAYQQAGISMPDVFPSEANTPDVIAERVRSVHAILAEWAGA